MSNDQAIRTRTEVRELHGIRGFAALLVFWYHARWKAGDPELIWNGVEFRAVLQTWDVGVCLFFVLSGYLLTISFRPWVLGQSRTKPALGRYLCRRITRILPLYYFAIAIFYLFSNSTYTFYGLLDLGLHTSCLHTFCNYSYLSINPVLWTIGIEFQFYLLLPLCMSVLKYGAKRVGIIASLLTIVATAWACHLGLQLVQGWLAPHVDDKFLTATSLPLSVFYYFPWFWIGICLAFFPISKQLEHSPTVANLVLAGSMSCLVALMFVSGEGQWRAVSLFGWPLNCILAATLIASAPYSRLGRILFGNRVAYLAGTLGYGIYIWHWPIQSAVFAGTFPARLGDGGLSLAAGGCLALLVTLFVSILTFRLIEEPAMSKGRTANSLLDLLVQIDGKFLHTSAASDK